MKNQHKIIVLGNRTEEILNCNLRLLEKQQLGCCAKNNRTRKYYGKVSDHKWTAVIGSYSKTCQFSTLDLTLIITVSYKWNYFRVTCPWNRFKYISKIWITFSFLNNSNTIPFFFSLVPIQDMNMIGRCKKASASSWPTQRGQGR